MSKQKSFWDVHSNPFTDSTEYLYKLEPAFEGKVESKEDDIRLGKQMMVIKNVLLKNMNSWLTVDEVHAMTFYPHASISAQLRNLRKEKHGGYDVEGRYREGTKIFEYRMNQ